MYIFTQTMRSREKANGNRRNLLLWLCFGEKERGTRKKRFFLSLAHIPVIRLKNTSSLFECLKEQTGSMVLRIPLFPRRHLAPLNHLWCNQEVLFSYLNSPPMSSRRLRSSEVEYISCLKVDRSGPSCLSWMVEMRSSDSPWFYLIISKMYSRFV